MPGVLPADAVGLVRIGALSGNMSGALREAANVARRRSEHTGMRFQGTLFYLCVVLFVLGFFATFLTIWIIPKFKVIFAGFNSKLPPLTEAIISICDSAGGYWYLMVLFPLVLVGAWVAMAISLEAMGWGPAWSRPREWTSDFWPRFRAPHVLRCLSVVVEAGRPLAEALNSMTARHPDLGLRSRISPIATAVDRGDDCWLALRNARMLRAGEAALLEAARRAGNLAWALREMAGGIERRAEYRYQLFMEFVHPALIVLVGSVIGTFCVGMFLPLITLVKELS
jgi:type IV pilus assembly protein PilC